VTPLTASSQEHGPDRWRECSGWFSQIGERLHPLLFNYLITVFFFSDYCVVLRVRRRRNGWPFYFVLFCIHEEPKHC